MASLTGDLEAARKRNDDIAAVLAAAQAAQIELAAANETLRAERDAALETDRAAATSVAGRVAALEAERTQLITERDTLKQVGAGAGWAW